LLSPAQVLRAGSAAIAARSSTRASSGSVSNSSLVAVGPHGEGYVIVLACEAFEKSSVRHRVVLADHEADGHGGRFDRRRGVCGEDESFERLRVRRRCVLHAVARDRDWEVWAEQHARTGSQGTAVVSSPPDVRVAIVATLRGCAPRNRVVFRVRARATVQGHPPPPTGLQALLAARGPTPR
jgi:hypothetical protein